MHFSGLNIIFAFHSFLSLIHLGSSFALPLAEATTTTVTVSNQLHTTGSNLSTRSGIEDRMLHFTLRNMNFCNSTLDKNQCVMGTHFIESTQEAEVYIFNYNCVLIGWWYPQQTTKAGTTLTMPGALPNAPTLIVSEWWPTFSYEGKEYNNPTCVEDRLGGASGCWQTFSCERVEGVA